MKKTSYDIFIEPRTTFSADYLDSSLLKSILDQYPYGLNVTQMDGTVIYGNIKFLEGVLEPVKTTSIGNYNILDAIKTDSYGLTEHIKKAFDGQLVTTKMLKFPNKELIDIIYGKESAFINLYQDITSYPIFNSTGIQTHVVTLFVPSEKVLKRVEVIETKKYIDIHWIEPLSLQHLTKLTSLSGSRLRKLFKEETGFTIHDYYNDIKMKHLCDALNKPNLSISDVFAQCGITYNSYYLNLFKKYTGHSPREYKQKKKKFEL